MVPNHAMETPRRPTTMSIGGATFDLFVRTDPSALKSDGVTLSLPLGAKIRVSEVIETCGGGASNTAVGLARLGCEASFCGVVGNDQWGEKLLQNLQKEGVDTRCATVVEGETTSSSIILSVGSGERVILYDSGTNSHLQDPTFDRESAGACEWIYLNHLHEESCEISDDVIAILAKKTNGWGLTWNPGGCQIDQGPTHPEIAALLKHTSVLLLNKEESLAFARCKTIEEATDSLLRTGAKIVCITDGANGATAADGMHTYHCPVIADAAVIDTTGAGDAFGTGFTWAILHGMDLPNCLRAGTINSTSVLGKLGAQEGLLTDIEMRARLQSQQLDVHVTA